MKKFYFIVLMCATLLTALRAELVNICICHNIPGGGSGPARKEPDCTLTTNSSQAQCNFQSKYSSPDKKRTCILKPMDASKAATYPQCSPFTTT